MFLRFSVSGAKAQGRFKVARGYRAVGMYAYGVRRHPDESARLRGHSSEAREEPHARHLRNNGCGPPQVREPLQPGLAAIFNWNDEFRRAHLPLRDATSLSLALAQQIGLST